MFVVRQCSIARQQHIRVVLFSVCIGGKAYDIEAGKELKTCVVFTQTFFMLVYNKVDIISLATTVTVHFYTEWNRVILYLWYFLSLPACFLSLFIYLTFEGGMCIIFPFTYNASYKCKLQLSPELTLIYSLTGSSI